MPRRTKALNLFALNVVNSVSFLVNEFWTKMRMVKADAATNSMVTLSVPPQ